MLKGERSADVDCARSFSYAALLIDKNDNSSHVAFPTCFVDSIILLKVQLYRCSARGDTNGKDAFLTLEA